MKTPLFITAVALVAAASAQAAATVTHDWSLGEDGLSLASDSVGAAHFTNPSGTIAVDSSKFSPLGDSTASLNFSGAFLYTPGGAVTGLTSGNWAVELSVYFTSNPSGATLFTLGAGGGNRGSQAMIDASGHIQFGQQNVAMHFTSTEVLATNTWNSVAWVNDSGVNKFFLNGTLIGSDSMNHYGLANNDGGLTLGTKAGGGSTFTGNLDNLRISTFAPGQFQTTDLMMNAVPEPATYGLIAAGALAGIAGIRRRRRRRAV